MGARGTEGAALAQGGGEATPSPRAAATEDSGRPGVSGGADAHGHPRASPSWTPRRPNVPPSPGLGVAWLSLCEVDRWFWSRFP